MKRNIIALVLAILVFAGNFTLSVWAYASEVEDEASVSEEVVIEAEAPEDLSALEAVEAPSLDEASSDALDMESSQEATDDETETEPETETPSELGSDEESQSEGRHERRRLGMAI